MKNQTKKVVLIQPRANSGRHIYLPNGLLAVAARLMAVGIEVTILDMNVNNTLSKKALQDAEWIGIGMLGAPSVPEAIKLALDLRMRSINAPIFFGGFVAGSIAEEDWKNLLRSQGCEKCIVIRTEEELGINLGIPDIPSIWDISMGPAIEALSPDLQKAYFSKEYCIFTSDGCVYQCEFCAASKGQKERFRNPDAFREEMEVLAKMTRKYAGTRPDYEIYLSTLDGLQNPDKMEPMLKIIRGAFWSGEGAYGDTIPGEGVEVSLRFLATAHYTHLALQKDPHILWRWHYDYAVKSISIGVDGADEVVWKALRKGHNKPDEIQAALLGIKHTGMVAEALMVIGFPNESREATIKAEAACQTLTEQGFQVRPYLAKINVPGTKGFRPEPFLGNNIKLLLHLDYAMVGSKVSHPDRKQRWFVNWMYLRTILYLKWHNPYGCPTQPLLPRYQGSWLFRWFAKTWNSWMPMDK